MSNRKKELFDFLQELCASLEEDEYVFEFEVEDWAEVVFIEDCLKYFCKCSSYASGPAEFLFLNNRDPRCRQIMLWKFDKWFNERTRLKLASRLTPHGVI